MKVRRFVFIVVAVAATVAITLVLAAATHLIRPRHRVRRVCSLSDAPSSSPTRSSLRVQGQHTCLGKRRREPGQVRFGEEIVTVIDEFDAGNRCFETRPVTRGDARLNLKDPRYSAAFRRRRAQEEAATLHAYFLQFP